MNITKCIARVQRTACALQIAAKDGVSRALLSVLEQELSHAVRDANAKGASDTGVTRAISDGSREAIRLQAA